MNIKNAGSLSELFYKWRLVTVLVGIVIFAIVSGYLLPPGVDWHLTYKPVSILAIEGKSPYTSDLPMPFLNAPWALLPIIPLGLLPENLGRGAFFIFSILGYSYFALRFGANRITLLAFLLSPPVLHSLLNATIDWIALLGFVLPPPIGVFFLLIKPQVGIGGIFFLLFASWKKGRFKELIRVFTPVSIALLLSFLIFGLWPLGFQKALIYNRNASLWPLSIPVALCLMVLAIRKHDIRHSIAASPCFSPYLLLHSWAGAMGAILSDTTLSITAFVGLWIVVILQAFA